ncbi:tigger transposable element-derived protein 1 [Trichonephila clavipes]|uniref:Tigger transposable element-derived protein 1 n=1 Tax=Trichonephila clavipes TaxID=2585209 RepID=A0A8X6SRB8_TRICX|nr:tigger transposable element-derived protein 1 [Trichonephila clavipes]
MASGKNCSSPLPINKTQAESVQEPVEICNVIEEVELARQINLKVNSDDVQELLDSHNQELTVDELIEMHEQEQDIEELESLSQLEDRIMFGNSAKGLSLIEKGLQILKNTDSNEEHIFSTKQGIKKYYHSNEILREKRKKNPLSRSRLLC